VRRDLEQKSDNRDKDLLKISSTILVRPPSPVSITILIKLLRLMASDNKMGRWGAISYVMGNIVGAGIFIAPTAISNQVGSVSYFCFKQH